MPDRHRTRAQERADEIDISPTALLAQIEALTAERDAAVATADEYLGASSANGPSSRTSSDGPARSGCATSASPARTSSARS